MPRIAPAILPPGAANPVYAAQKRDYDAEPDLYVLGPFTRLLSRNERRWGLIAPMHERLWREALGGTPNTQRIDQMCSISKAGPRISDAVEELKTYNVQAYLMDGTRFSANAERDEVVDFWEAVLEALADGVPAGTPRIKVTGGSPRFRTPADVIALLGGIVVNRDSLGGPSYHGEATITFPNGTTRPVRGESSKGWSGNYEPGELVWD